MIQYEYRVVSQADSATSTIEKMLNGMGQEGWELINITGGPSTFYYFFKRAITLLHS